LGNIRRSRGYNFEHTLVQRLNNAQWRARRLGGSSTGLPDIVAVNNDAGILLTIEAKSGTSDILYVPLDQIERCLMVRNMFGIYPERHIILAFKFMGKKRFRRKNETVYESRRLTEYYKVADIVIGMKALPIVKCTYDGKTYAIFRNKTVPLGLPDYNMPFHKLARRAPLVGRAGLQAKATKTIRTVTEKKLVTALPLVLLDKKDEGISTGSRNRKRERKSEP
jgi:Holliday junction resolvase